MEAERPEDDSELQRQIDDLRERVAVNRADNDSLVARADDANHPAGAIEARVDASDKQADGSGERADAADRRADASEELSADDRRRIADLEEMTRRHISCALRTDRSALVSTQLRVKHQTAVEPARRETMSRVLGVHEIELVPGTDPGAFEQAAAEVVSVPQPDGWRTLVLKGERGPRSGKYLMVFEIDSLELRDRLFPEEGHADPEENERFDQEHPETEAAFERLAAMVVDLNVATDYVVIAE